MVDRDHLNQHSVDDARDEAHNSAAKGSTIASGADDAAAVAVTQSVALQKVPQFSSPLDGLDATHPHNVSNR